MNYYPGICIIEIERVALLESRHGNRFLRRCFTSEELRYCTGRSARHSRLASRLAAKIAVRRALLLADVKPPPLAGLEVKRDEWGKPSIHADRPIPCSLLLSLSHSRDYAVASAIIERMD